jgi:membrane protein implicated in regulation of membrane protease activity
MHLSGWELWLAAALLLAGGELFHGAFVLAMIAVACLPAAAASALGAGPALQLAFFTAALFAEIPLLKPLAQRRRKALTTNAEAIVGKRVKVLQAVREHEDGVVLLTGEHWKARSLAGEVPPGAEAQVIHRDGLLLMIVPLEKTS